MIEVSEGIRRAQEFLDSSSIAEVPLVADELTASLRGEILFVPCNSDEYLRTENPEVMVIGCTPVRVDLRTGECRFLTLDELVELDL
ncbi:hypothetical protein [Streptomyces sp. NPDC058632]|uniref:hypothetical protein n=1 Tax=Streptomyces sp. NPDC058632 TaxID=3346567 RepID=UPI003650A6A0